MTLRDGSSLASSGTGGLDIVPVTAGDEDLLRSWHAVDRRAGAHGRAAYNGNSLETARTLLRAEDRGFFDYAAFLGSVDGEPVASGWAALSRRDNLDQAWVFPRVLPECRRRGHGTAMLAHLTAWARDAGRSVLNSSAYWPPDAGADGTGAAGAEFARKHGFALGLAEMKRKLALPIPGDRLDELADRAARHHRGYRIEAASGPIPDRLVGQWAEITASLSTEAPSGTLESEPDTPSVAAVREEEAELAESGEGRFWAVALDPDGRIAAYTDLEVDLAEPSPASQEGTLVRRTDRGRRLGLAVKVAVLRLLQSERPDITATITETAAGNQHMIAINELLGYEPQEWMGNYQKPEEA